MTTPIKAEVLINENNLNTGIVKREYPVIYSNNYWHKVYVLNATKYSRDFVLRTIMKAMHPYDFIPVCFNIEGDYVTFMLKNCGDAISHMCRLLLTIPHPDINRNLPSFKLSIALKHAHASELKIEIQLNISNILKRRYNAQTKTLNLEAFAQDADLIEFCPLSQPKLMYFVLHLSRELDIECLKLNYNEIEVLKPLEALHPEKGCKNLSTLDLQKNNISNVEELKTLQLFSLTEVVLKDNPFLSNLSEKDYIKLLKELCPNLQKLDKMPLPSVGIVHSKRNFVCNTYGQDFVDQFLEHFFNLYDSHNRHLLASMYHPEACFTITSQYTNDQLGTFEQLFEFKKYSRNLKTLSDLSKSFENIFIGTESISNMLKSLPGTEHDPYTFTVDLMQFTEKNGIVTVTGLFREPGKNLLMSDYYFFFTRSFLLRAVNNLEYQIMNDMLHVSNATTAQQENAFKVTRVPFSPVLTIEDAKTLSEKNEMINAFVTLTTLRPEWAAKLLKEFDYNFKKSLGVFMDLFKQDKFPSVAFDLSEMSNPVQQPISSRANEQSTSTINQSKINQIMSVTTKKPPAMVQPPKPTVIPISLTQPNQRKEKNSSSKHSASVSEKPVTLHSIIPAPDKKQSNQNTSTVTTVPKPIEIKKKELETKTVEAVIDLVDALPKQVAPIITPAVKPLIKINIQKTYAGPTPPTITITDSSPSANKTTPVPKMSPDPSDYLISTDVDNIKSYVKDPLILKVLNMTIDTPIDTVKENLRVACQQILKNYTCAIKYYKAIGKEFYRFQLFSEARIFLADAMARIPNKMGEQLYCIFTLFEIQYGDSNIAENMILMIAETLKEDKAAIFLTKVVAKVNVGFVRKIFGSVSSSALEKDKKISLLKAYVEFEQTHGNIDTINYATKTLQEAMSNSPSKAARENEEGKSVDKDKVKTEIVASSSVEQIPVEVKEKIPTKSFEEFREELLLIAGIMPKKVSNPRIDQLVRAKDKATAEAQGQALLTVNPTNFYIIRLVWKIWRNFDLSTKVAKSLADIKQCLKDDSKILNPLILYLKVREDLDKGKFDLAGEKLLTHIKISPDVQIIQVFEDLLVDIRKNTTYIKCILKVLRNSIDSTKISLLKTKLLTLIYLTFCQIINSNEADEKYMELIKVLPFHPEDCKGENLLAGKAVWELEYPFPRQFKSVTIAGQIEEMGMYFKRNKPEFPRHLKKKHNKDKPFIFYNCIIMENLLDYDCFLENFIKFGLALGYFEILYGTPAVGINRLKQTNDNSFNSTFIQIFGFLKVNNKDEAKKIFKSVLDDILIVMNPHAQKLLYRYYQQFIQDGYNIFDLFKD